MQGPRRFCRYSQLSFLVVLLIATPNMPVVGQDRHPEDPDVGIPVHSELVVDRCSRCHDLDEHGRMSRISYLRKTPEGWQTSVRRMVVLHRARVNPDQARAIVRYLADSHGLAPEEARPAMFEAERRMIDYRYEADEETETTCKQCHSVGRVLGQRRTEEEWGLLIATHRGLYPDADFQAFRRGGPAPPDVEDPRHPMDKAIAHLSSVFPHDTPEWRSWSATRRTPRLDGTWVVAGHAPGRGPVFGTVEMAAGGPEADVTTTARLVFPAGGDVEERSGRAVVYTGFQWRGRSTTNGDAGELREVMFIERDWQSMWGRWYTGAYDELGLDMRVHRAGRDAMIAGLYPVALPVGSEATVTIYGANLPTEAAAVDIDLGPGVTVRRVTSATAEAVTVVAAVGADAIRGARDVFVGTASLEGALVVYERVDRIAVTPRAGMARVGGAAFPKGYQQFEVVGFDNGVDGEPETGDDLELGPVQVEWGLEEYAVTYDDSDLAYVGSIDETGLFTPALDGPNPEREGRRNNIGDVWVVATHMPADGRAVRARAHLLVTVPLYIRWDPWPAARSP